MCRIPQPPRSQCCRTEQMPPKPTLANLSSWSFLEFFVIPQRRLHRFERHNSSKREPPARWIVRKLDHLSTILERLHARLSAAKFAGYPNNLVRFKDDATIEELRQEIMWRLGDLQEAGAISRLCRYRRVEQRISRSRLSYDPQWRTMS